MLHFLGLGRVMEYTVDPLLHLESHEVFAGNNALDPTMEKGSDYRERYTLLLTDFWWIFCWLFTTYTQNSSTYGRATWTNLVFECPCNRKPSHNMAKYSFLRYVQEVEALLLRRRLSKIETVTSTLCRSLHATQVTKVWTSEKLVLSSMRVIGTNLFLLSTTVKCLSKQDMMLPVRTN